MLIIPPALHKLYDGFELEITGELAFMAGERYYLSGANGSGKTSFLQRTLLPKLLEHPEKQYILYLEQQMRGQFLALKAYAAYSAYHQPVNCEADAVDYLLHNLRQCLSFQTRPIVLVVDESSAAQPVRDLYVEHMDTSCLIEVSHADSSGRKDWITLEFSLEHTGLARVRER